MLSQSLIQKVTGASVRCRWCSLNSKELSKDRFYFSPANVCSLIKQGINSGEVGENDLVSSRGSQSLIKQGRKKQ
jgi:hypothetical protein